MKRVFISFAIEDKWARDYLVGQAKNDNSPFEFVDMSVKEPWDEDWKERCRTRIKGCDGVIAMVRKEYGQCFWTTMGTKMRQGGKSTYTRSLHNDR